MLVEPLYAYSESSASQLLELLAGDEEGRRNLPRANAVDQHLTVHVCNLFGVHDRDDVAFRARLKCVWRP